ncbi:adenylosuccinate synthetase [Actinomycetota bacterium]|nr:adenylosuccinate synthetase [Actinomycetota bacterium]
MAGIVLVGTQWGDEGKGKATDLLGNKVDYVVKFNGGNNAGHTVVIDDEKYALHLLPSGILTPGVVPVIGNGVVVDVEVLFDELDALIERGVDVSKLKVSARAHVITKYHRQLDKAMESDKAKTKIGTTGRGIGPTYADKISRSGIRIADLFRPEILQDKIISALDSKNRIFSRYGQPEITPEEVIAEFEPYLERLKPMVTDVPTLLNAALDDNKNVLFEAGQATMLDVDFGTYPFVTSSNATAGGAITGSGVGPTRVSSVVGVIKAYTTRVGEGPFPTELYPSATTPSCGDPATKTQDDGKAHWNDDDRGQAEKTGEFLLKEGGEFGVTTGRARRCGWFDAVVARYSGLVNGLTDLVLTKLDVLTGLDTIKVCVAYEVDGKIVEVMPNDEYDFEQAKPVYKEFPGWKEDICGARSFADLPKNAQDYVKELEKLSGTRISVIGVGASRDAIIQLYDIIH